MSDLPKTMRAVELKRYADAPRLSVVKRPVPAPRDGEVLVKIAAAPINPSDLMFLRGLYGVKKSLPVVPGFEGSGEVVAAGKGAESLVGRRVAVNAPKDGDGTWAEYVRAPAAACIPLLKGVDLEQAAMLIVNPLTAYALVDLAKRGGHKAIIQTAAASALGRMVVRLAKREGIETVNVVRRREQVRLVLKDGATHVLDSSSKRFAAQLKEVARAAGASVAFDAVGGPLTQDLAAALAPGSTIHVYGALSGENAAVDPSELIFRGIRVEGFWLPKWRASLSEAQRRRSGVAVQKLLLEGVFSSEIRDRVPLTGVSKALAAYAGQMTAGKMLLVP